MEKKRFKKVFSKVFVASIAALAVSGSVNAYSVTETRDPQKDDGIYIYGITRFSNSTKLLPQVTSKAALNENKFLGYPDDYEVPDVYQYVFGSWFGMNSNGEIYTPTADVIAGLNQKDIYYVDNVEKTIPVSYHREIPEGYEIMAKTNIAGQVVEYDEETGTLYIPVTAETITVYQHKIGAEGNADDQTLDTFYKEEDKTNKSEFDYTNNSTSYGTITADGVYTLAKDVTTDKTGNVITIGGTIKWANANGNLGVINADSKVSGHRIGVYLTVPNLTNLDTTNLSTITVKVTPYDNGAELEEGSTKNVYKWEAANTNSNNQFWFTPVVKAGEKYTLEVTWAEGVTQTFTINVAGELEEMPAGSLAGETKYMLDEEGKLTTTPRLTASATDDTVTFSGKNAEWGESVTVLVTPDAEYTKDPNFVLGSATVKYTNKVKNADEEWEDSELKNVSTSVKTVDGTAVLAIELPIAEDNADEKGRTRTVTVTWPDGYEQSFDVVLADNTEFKFPAVDLTSAHTTKPFYPEEETPDMVEVTGIVNWNTTKGGNRVNVTLTLPETGTTKFSADKKYLTVRVDGEVITEKDDNNKDVPVTFSGNTLTFDFVATKRPQTVEVLYNGEKVVKTFTVDTSRTTLEEAPEGSILSSNEGVITGKYTKSTRTLTVYAKNDDETELVPFNYDLYNNATGIQLSNTEYGNVADKVVYKYLGVDYTLDQPDDNGYYQVKIGKNRTTEVTVYWDDMNSETFYVKADTETRFATAESGVITSEVMVDDDTVQTDTVELDNTVSATWGATTNLEKNVDGYVLSDIYLTAPEGSGTTLGKGAYLIIKGGHYGSEGIKLDEVSLNKSSILTTVTYTETDTTPAVTHSATRKVLKLNPILATANDNLTITVCWGGEFVEEYYVRAVGVNLVNTQQATAKVGSDAKYSATSGTIYYSEVVPYDSTSDLHMETVTLTAAAGGALSDIDRAYVKDAEDFDAYEKDTDEKFNVRDITAAARRGSFDIYLTDEKRTVDVVIEWTNGFKQELTIDASKAKLPTIILSDSLKKDKDGNYVMESGNYVLEAKVGDTIKLVNGTSPIDYNQYVTYTFTNNNAALDASKKAVDDETMKALNVGTATVTVSLNNTEAGNTDMGAKAIKVNVHVLTDEAVAITNADVNVDTKNNKIVVSANVSGGYSGQYNFRVDGFVLETNKNNADYGDYVRIYAASDYSTEFTVKQTAAIKNADGKYVVEFEFTDADTSEDNKVTLEDILARDYKFVITAEDQKNSTINETSLEATLDVVTDPVQYRVTVKPENGSANTNLSVKPGSTIADLKLDELAKDITKTHAKAEKKWVFEGWAIVTAETPNPTAGDVLTAANAGDVIRTNTTIVAVWTEANVENAVTLIYANGDKEVRHVEYNKTAGLTGVWYEDNETNFDVLGNIRNDAVKFDNETKITDKITLRSIDTSVLSQDQKEDKADAVVADFATNVEDSNNAIASADFDVNMAGSYLNVDITNANSANTITTENGLVKAISAALADATVDTVKVEGVEVPKDSTEEQIKDQLVTALTATRGAASELNVRDLNGKTLEIEIKLIDGYTTSDDENTITYNVVFSFAADYEFVQKAGTITVADSFAEANAQEIKDNNKAVESITYVGNDVTITLNGALTKYTNGSGLNQKWIGLAIELDKAPEDLVPLEEGNAHRYSIEETDYSADSKTKFSVTGDNAFVMWIAQERIEEDGTIEFADGTIINFTVVDKLAKVNNAVDTLNSSLTSISSDAYGIAIADSNVTVSVKNTASGLTTGTGLVKAVREALKSEVIDSMVATDVSSTEYTFNDAGMAADGTQSVVNQKFGELLLAVSGQSDVSALTLNDLIGKTITFKVNLASGYKYADGSTSKTYTVSIVDGTTPVVP